MRACHIRKVFATGGGDLEILKEVGLQLQAGEVVAIMGASGVGKSTLLYILGALDRPTEGELYVNEMDVFKMSESEVARFRNRHMGFVFQFHHLLPEFTALENVMLPSMIAARDKGEGQRQATELLRSVGLEKRLHHRPGELSGGECQRVAVARALSMRPTVVLADEPSGNLDAASSENLHNLIRELSRVYNQAFVIMTHDQALAASADRMGLIEEGSLRI
ncbi:MAG: ATP-binding cassette domain-containing protein [Candidatus Latescibacteria bacterium]|nr:ATP-binding cassette domain-containing protein [Candidatus Latescibacterota bacterium]